MKNFTVRKKKTRITHPLVYSLQADWEQGLQDHLKNSTKGEFVRFLRRDQAKNYSLVFDRFGTFLVFRYMVEPSILVDGWAVEDAPQNKAFQRFEFNMSDVAICAGYYPKVLEYWACCYWHITVYPRDGESK